MNLTHQDIIVIQEKVMESFLSELADKVTTAMNEEGFEGSASDELLDMVADNIFKWRDSQTELTWNPTEITTTKGLLTNVKFQRVRNT